MPIFSAFALILIAELGDKIQLSVISLSCNYKWQHVFAGSMLAFLVVDGVSALIGGTLLAFVPLSIVQVASGIVFIIFGIFPFLRKEKNNDIYSTKKRSNIPLISSFLLVALTELGDKTQILTITLAAQSSPIPVLLGMFFAFMLLTSVAVFLGTKLVSRLPINLLKTGTSIVFIILGVISIFSGIFQFSLF